MKSIEAPINGSNYKGVQHVPELALQPFYAAFNGCDLELMSENRAPTDEISLDNPLGGIRRGWAEIRLLYERLFSGPASVYVEFCDYTLHVGQALFYAAGRERGYFRPGDTGLVLAIRTSRIYKNIEGKWRQGHHHGSIDDPELPARYQSAVMGNRWRIFAGSTTWNSTRNLTRAGSIARFT